MRNVDRQRTEAESDRRAREQHDEGGEKDDGALGGGTHALIPNGGSRPLTRQ